MQTFILIHNACYGSWNWHKVILILENQGHTVIAIDLPVKTTIQEVTLKSTAIKIRLLIDSFKGKVILVGHSKIEFMISPVAVL